MRTEFRFLTLGAIAATAIAIAGCAGTPVENKNLNDAKAAYQSAAGNPEVTKYAPVALKEAEESLRAVEAQSMSGDSENLDHNAYLARQKVAIAVQRAKLNAAEDQVNKARAERNRTILEARVSDAEKSRRMAEIRAKEAEQARAEAESARVAAESSRLAAEKSRAESEAMSAELAALKARGTERGLVLTLGDVLFGFNRAELAPGGEREVSKLSDFLKRYPKRNVMVEGFTDSVGSVDYNIGLSERRANAVRTALVNSSIDPGRIQTRGYGKSFPVADNATDSGRQLNRRVEIIISDDKGMISPRTK